MLWRLRSWLGVPPESTVFVMWLSIPFVYCCENTKTGKGVRKECMKGGAALYRVLSSRWLRSLALQHVVQCKLKWLAQTGCRPSWKEISLSIHTSFRGNWSRKDLPRELYENKLKNRNVYNVDETGVYTVQVPNKITVAKWKNQISFMTSSESGTLATECVAVSAMECCAPQTFVFPRKRINGYFLQCGAVRDIGPGNGCACCKDNFRHLKTFCKTSQSNER
jgi:hypothetical protein